MIPSFSIFLPLTFDIWHAISFIFLFYYSSTFIYTSKFSTDFTLKMMPFRGRTSLYENQSFPLIPIHLSSAPRITRLCPKPVLCTQPCGFITIFLVFFLYPSQFLWKLLSTFRVSLSFSLKLIKNFANFKAIN